LADCAKGHRGLAGEDAGACLQPGREELHRIDELQSGADATLGIVLVITGCPRRP
jgi:hypothetical protein